MDQALLKLLRLRFHAAVRRIWRSLKTPRGAVFFAIGAVMIVLWLGPTLFFNLIMNRPEAGAARESLSGSFRELMPLGLLAICLMTLLTSPERAVQFSPAEVNFLFSGPFSRRQILLYKISLNTVGALITSMIFTIFLLQYATSLVPAFVGCLLTILFMQLFNMTVVLVGQTVAERAYTRARRILVAGLLVIVALGIWRTLPSVENASLIALASAFRGSPVGTVLLAPFDVFVRATLAETIFPGLVVWASLAFSINLALLAVVMWLDANYLEAAVAASARMHRLMQQARRGGIILAPQRSARWRLPPFPWLAGAGPIAWRQLTTALRRSYLMIGLLLLVAAMTGPALTIAGAQREAIIPVAGIALWVTMLMLPRALPFDFRGDVDYLDWLKSVPLQPAAIAVGQLIAPVAIATSLHVVLIAGLASFVPEYWPFLLAAGAIAPPLNVLLFGLENVIFLLFPSRTTTVTPGDFQAMGRTMVEFAVKMLVLVFCSALAALVGLAAYFVAGRSWTAFGVAAWCVLSGMAVLIVPPMVWAYRRFDVSLDTPA